MIMVGGTFGIDEYSAYSNNDAAFGIGEGDFLNIYGSPSDAYPLVATAELIASISYSNVVYTYDGPGDPTLLIEVTADFTISYLTPEPGSAGLITAGIAALCGLASLQEERLILLSAPSWWRPFRPTTCRP